MSLTLIVYLYKFFSFIISVSGKCGFSDGSFDTPVSNEPNILSEKECRQFYLSNTLKIFDREFIVQNINNFSVQINLYGFSADKDLNCSNTNPFWLKGRFYESHYVVATFKGSVTAKRYKVDSQKSEILIDAYKINTENKNTIETQNSTLVWIKEKRECYESIKEIFTGSGILYLPTGERKETKVIVTSSGKSIGFDIEFMKPQLLCGKIVYKTQLDSIFVAISRQNFLWH